LERIYHAAYAGLKGDSLAVASGMTPTEYRKLRDNDPHVEMAEAKGRADSELEHAMNLAEASRNGDAKAALEILKHVHGWVAKQQVDVKVQSVHVSHLEAIRALMEDAPDTIDVTPTVLIEDDRANERQPVFAVPEEVPERSGGVCTERTEPGAAGVAEAVPPARS
jgi:hypothetical protein